jgi:type I restriction enzyme R subunit
VDIIVIKVKKDSLPPGHGLHQATGYAKAQRLNVPFVLATNGHVFVQFDRYTGPTTDPCPMAAFPSPVDLRAHVRGCGGLLAERPRRPRRHVDANAGRPALVLLEQR